MSESAEIPPVQMAPLPTVPGVCLAGHARAFRPETTERGIVMVEFCPRCEGTGVPPAEVPHG